MRALTRGRGGGGSSSSSSLEMPPRRRHIQLHQLSPCRLIMIITKLMISKGNTDSTTTTTTSTRDNEKEEKENGQKRLKPRPSNNSPGNQFARAFVLCLFVRPCIGSPLKTNQPNHANVAKMMPARLLARSLAD